MYQNKKRNYCGSTISKSIISLLGGTRPSLI